MNDLFSINKEDANLVWKDIPGYDELYEVSETGIVRSKVRILYYHDTINIHNSRVLKPYENLDHTKTRVTGLRVTLSKNNIQKRFFIHQLVMLAFKGPCPDGMEVAHNDGNCYNNNFVNLRYCSHSDNEMDKVKHGTMNYGRQHHKHEYQYVVLDPQGNEHVIVSPQLFFRERMEEMEARKFAKHVCDKSRIKSNKVNYHGWTLKEVI